MEASGGEGGAKRWRAAGGVGGVGGARGSVRNKTAASWPAETPPGFLRARVGSSPSHHPAHTCFECVALAAAVSARWAGARCRRARLDPRALSLGTAVASADPPHPRNAYWHVRQLRAGRRKIAPLGANEMGRRSKPRPPSPSLTALHSRPRSSLTPSRPGARTRWRWRWPRRRWWSRWRTRRRRRSKKSIHPLLLLPAAPSAPADRTWQTTAPRCRAARPRGRARRGRTGRGRPGRGAGPSRRGHGLEGQT